MESIRSEQQRKVFAGILKRKTKLIAAGKAQRFAFPGGGDPDDLGRLRKQYKEANGGRPLWDEPDEPGPTAVTGFASAPQRPGFAQILDSCIERKLGPSSVAYHKACAEARKITRLKARASLGPGTKPETNFSAIVRSKVLALTGRKPAQ